MRITMILGFLTLFVACKKKTETSLKQFENSKNICLSIENYTKRILSEDPAKDGQTVFNAKVQSEKQILAILIRQYSVAGNKGTNRTTSKATQKDTPTDSGQTHESPLEKSLNIADDTSGLCSNANGILPFPNVPPHPAEIDSSDIAQRVVAKYCLQLAELSAPSCRPFESDQASKVESSKAVDARSSSVTTGGCATLGAAVRPEWINESCEVTQSIFSSTLKSVAKDACKIISTSAMSNASKCTDGVIPAVCKAVYDGASDLVSYLAKEAGETDPQPNELVLERLTNSFTSTVFACLSGLAKESIKKSIISGSSSTWARTIIGHEAAASILAKNGATVKVTGAALRKEALKQAGLALCSAGAKAVAKTLNSTPPKMFRSACGGSTESENQARLAACLLSTASACSAASGGVDFAAIIDVKEGASKLTADTISMAAMAGCGITGKVGGTACGVINEAALQIVKAVKTGNNDWADCAGTRKFGQCIGETYASWSAGITKESATGKVEQTENIAGEDFSLCCTCDRVFYQNDGVFKNTIWRRDRILKGKTSFVKGGVDQSSCSVNNNLPQSPLPEKRRGFNIYYKYEQCKQYYLNTDSCLYGFGNRNESYGNKIPSKKVDGHAVNEAENPFGSPDISLGTFYCLDNDC